ncbi:MAG: T9SS type A sorting domain-containing protein [bacterium]|nr:T9SS type A sorting domain-containing protein [bacterium]
MMKTVSTLFRAITTRSIFFWVLAFITFDSPAHAQDSLNIRLASQYMYWDTAIDIVKRGSISAIATGPTGVVFAELLNNTISQTGSIQTQGNAEGLSYANGLLVVCEGVNGIEIFGWNDTSPVTLLSNISLPTTQSYCSAIKDTILVIGTLDGLYTYSIADPVNPAPIGHITLNVNVRAIAIRDTIAVLSVSSPGLLIINLADPVNLPTISSLESTSSVMSSAWIDSTHIICAESNRVRTISLENPASPQVLGQATMLGTATSVTVRDTVAYVSSQSAGLRVVGLSNLMAPSILGGGLTQSGARKAVLEGQLAFVADGQYGFSVVDVSSPTTPLLFASYDPPARMEAIAKIGDYAYIGSFGKGLRIVDVSNRYAPIEVNSVFSDRYPIDLTTIGNTIYSLASYRDRALQIVDVAAPQNPQLLGSFPLSFDAYGFDAKDGYGFIAYGTYGLRVVSVPTNPTLIRSIDTIGFTRDIEIVDSTAFIAVDGGKLLVWNVADPMQPRQIFSYTFTGHPQSIAVSGQFCFVVDSDSGLRVFSADQTERQQIATIPIPNLLSIAVSGYHVYAACGYDGLKVYSLHNPFDPRLVGYYDTRGAVLEITVEDGFAYVADRTSLSIFDCNEAVSVEEETSNRQLPNNIALLSAYPNPFNASTTVTFSLPHTAPVRIQLFNVTGQLLETLSDSYREAGTHSFSFSGNNLAAGTYIIAAQLGNEQVSKKIVLLK